tara:strand:- start:937 stop:1227 length:291 start_codon:yes stop_codon:yes gene_type:complete
MGFQKTVLIVALIVFSCMLFFIALAMKGLKKSQKFPPEISECPDYWIRDSNSCKPGAFNRGASGTTDACEIYDGSSDKTVWSADCAVEWDGVTNIK